MISWEPINFGPEGREPIPKQFSPLVMVGTCWLMLTLGVIGALTAGRPMSEHLLPFVLGMLIVGLPHGAADHLLLWGLGRDDSTRSRTIGLLGYVGLALVYLALWAIMPVMAAGIFLGITMYHWGQGDLYCTVRLHGARYLERSATLAWLHTLLRGSIPLAVPAVMHQDFVAAFIIRMSGDSTHWLSTLAVQPAWQSVAIGIWCVLVLAYFGGVLRRHQAGESWAMLVDALEMAGLTLFFVMVPPEWAVGCYFLVWHSARHAMRILWLDRKGVEGTQARLFWSLTTRWLKLTTCMTVVALSAAGIFVLHKLTAGESTLDIFVSGIVLISVVTLPHTVVVYFMDRRQIFRGAEDGRRPVQG